MAITQNTYTGDGSTVLFSFTFPYLETTDIKVSLDGTDTNAYTLANATTVQFTTAPANGVAIRIYRQTDDTDLTATFYPGSAIRSQDLNDNFTQNLYVTQESSNNATTAISTANSAVTTANSAVSTANSAVSTANSAVTTANNAVTTANDAATDAADAVTTANSAVTTANSAEATAISAASDAATAVSTANDAATDAATAISTANDAATDAATAISTANDAATDAATAISTANTASTNATTAVNTANSAVTTANNAVSTANTADSNASAALNAVAGTVQYVLVANVAAIPGSPNDGDGIEVADSTGIESFTPLANIPAGFVGDTGLSVRMQYSSSGSTWNWLNYFANNSETRYLKLAGGTLTGAVRVPLGSASSPSITPSGDTNTGIYSPGADQVAISTGGTGRLFVDASGNVGVGKSSLTGTLQVYASSAPSFYLQNVDSGTGSTDGFSLALVGSDAYINNRETGNMRFLTANTERLRITSDGKLGLGTSAPDTILHVHNATAGTVTASTNAHLVVENSANTGINILTPSNQNGQILFGDPDDNDIGRIQYNHTSDYLALYTNANERLRIDSSGNVGIGTNSPLEVLHVRTGSSGVSSALAGVDGAIIETPAGRTGGVVFHTPNDRSAGIYFSDPDASARGYYRYDHNGDYAAVATAGSERLRIDSSGKVGIGTSSPAADLDVNGAGLVTNLLIRNNAGTPTLGTTPQLYSPASGTLAVSTSSSERLRIDSSGRLLVGSSTSYTGGSPSYPQSQIQLHGKNYSTSSFSAFHWQDASLNSSFISLNKSRGAVGTNTIVPSGDRLGGISFSGADGTGFIPAAYITAEVDGTPGTNDMPGRISLSTTPSGSASPVERMRIESTGTVRCTQPNTNNDSLVLQGTNASFAGSLATFATTRGAGTDCLFIYGLANSVQAFIVYNNGNILNTNNSYAGISDIKLKENIVDASSQWDDLKALQVRNYNFKEGQTHTQIGLIAQEVELVSPGLVSESPDRDEEGNDLGTTTKSVNYSVLYMKAVKALQEAMERIEVLEAKVNALEGN